MELALGLNMNQLAGNSGLSFPPSKTGWMALSGYVQTKPSGYENRTFQVGIPVEGDYESVNIIAKGNEASTWQLDSLIIRAASSIDPFGAPVGGTWIDAVTVPLTVPARVGVNVPSSVSVGSKAIAAIPSTDGTGRFYFFARAYISVANWTGYGNTSQFNGTGTGSNASDGLVVWRDRNDSRTAGRVVEISDQGGDFVSSNRDAFDSSSGNYGFPALEFEFQFKNNVVTVSAYGNSMTNGDEASIYVLSPLHYAIKEVSTPAKPVAAAQEGFSSTTTTNFVARIQADISAGRKPSIMVYSAFSPNDGLSSQVPVDIMKANTETVIALCKAHGIYTVLTTGIPGLFNTADDARRVAYNDYIRALAGPGISICDYDAALTNGATPARIAAIYADGDPARLHPYDAGYVKMGKDVLAPVLASIISAYF